MTNKSGEGHTCSGFTIIDTSNTRTWGMAQAHSQSSKRDAGTSDGAIIRLACVDSEGGQIDTRHHACLQCRSMQRFLHAVIRKQGVCTPDAMLYARVAFVDHFCWSRNLELQFTPSYTCADPKLTLSMAHRAQSLHTQAHRQVSPGAAIARHSLAQDPLRSIHSASHIAHASLTVPNPERAGASIELDLPASANQHRTHHVILKKPLGLTLHGMAK